MSNKKYFSVDVSNDTHIVELHETLEQAKQCCLAGATDAYEWAGESDEYENYENYDLPHAVYGVVLGRAKSDTRPLTDEERKSGYYHDHIDHIVEPPELVEVDGWISVDEQKPSDGQEVIILYNNEPRIAIANKVVDGRILFDFGFEHVDESEWNAMSRFEGLIKYWQPLPSPPEQ